MCLFVLFRLLLWLNWLLFVVVMIMLFMVKFMEILRVVAESMVWLCCCFCGHVYDVDVVFDIVDVLGSKGACYGIRTH